jgi:hydrogenase nickel incorporation protein HypA/HybF
MHELSITQSVVTAVCAHAGESRVTCVRVRVGKLCGVVPDAMRFCFDLVTEGTVLDGAELVIDEPPGQARCRSCGARFELADLILLCPCGSADVEIIAGRELMVQSIEVA